MSELKSYTIYEGDVGNYTEHVVYSKSEVDEVITELKAQKAQAEDDCAYWKMREGNAVNAMHETEEACMYITKSERHQKYKRCLAMAMWCEATALWCYQAANTLPAGFHATLYGKPVMIEPNRLFNRHVLLTKWSYRWSELADKFKETK